MKFETCFRSNLKILMEGALGLRLQLEFGLSPDEHVAWASTIYSEPGKAALETLLSGYIKAASDYHLPFICTTPTRRANQERVALSSFDTSIIADNVEFLKNVRAKSGHAAMFIGGLMGCRGDAYTANDALDVDEAFAFHTWQAKLFADAGVDFLYAGIMPALPEAVGMAQAMSGTGLPYIISFTIREDGRLVDGTPIHDAISIIDKEANPKPLCYMTNCVHPSTAYKALSQPFNRTQTVQSRFRGIQANASPLSAHALDHHDGVMTSPPDELASHMMRLTELADIKIFGGCCGTNKQHIRCIAHRIANSKDCR